MSDHWPSHARAWSLVGPPLRPCTDDIQTLLHEIHFWRGRPTPENPETLVLGVTPEIVGTLFGSITCVDREPAMIEAMFEPRPDHRALVGEWLALPVPDAAFDLVVCDGGLSVFAFPGEYRAIAKEIARVLRPGGLFMPRLFACPDVPETLDDVRAALPTIESFDALKWRIAMAIQSPERSVRVSAIRDAFDSLVPDRAALAERTGWRREVIDHIDIYRDSPASYSFPTLYEVTGALAPELVHRSHFTPRYELGDRCPTVVFERGAS